MASALQWIMKLLAPALEIARAQNAKRLSELLGNKSKRKRMSGDNNPRTVGVLERLGDAASLAASDTGDPHLLFFFRRPLRSQKSVLNRAHRRGSASALIRQKTVSQARPASHWDRWLTSTTLPRLKKASLPAPTSILIPWMPLRLNLRTELAAGQWSALHDYRLRVGRRNRRV
ncbi:hypothetical protein DFH08DRAFT_82157 [Mycena albidolilacea]|uniref:Uncharacterized protein n=1 Tax=Mycena albidolilacea TaxID=1033008 RepID=A0AAD7EU75_9AGAR|nr:hypothetical protein DFH08DRAFT_82157 [Mycena albidolilacea]